MKHIDALDENVQIMKCILCFNISCFFLIQLNMKDYKEENMAHNLNYKITFVDNLFPFHIYLLAGKHKYSCWHFLEMEIIHTSD